ncbi:protein FAM161A-like [Polyodon spathula]|uniref:protein FAM161A-like n=1 Tax=Polyodon spathula TaxID=7913 RepID=UPI001B7F3922|nr:protein FAM161A-like [Polyodon spathula]
MRGEKATRSFRQSKTNSQEDRRDNRYYEDENESECDSYTEENESSFLLKDCRVPGTQLDFTNEEYYRKLEELKNAHLDTMAQLERMYQNKLKLKGVVVPEKTELHCRSQWKKTPNTPTAFSANYNACSNLSDASDEFVVDNETENQVTGIVLSPREHIKSMWDGFSIGDYNSSETCQLLRSPRIQKTKRKVKDWSPKITVPEPFHMTVREAEKKKKNFKSRSDIEMETCLLKKQLEELMESQKFRANPVPAHVYLPLYEETVERNEERRQSVKERTKVLVLASQKPFSFIEREEKRKERKKAHVKDLAPKRKKTTFKAKPVPKYLNDPTIRDRLKEEELYCKIKMQMRSQELLYSSSLPRSMLTCSASGKRKEHSTVNDKETDSHPRINTEIPDFEAKYRRFHKRLLKKRDTKPMTICEPFAHRTVQIPTHRNKILADIKSDESRLMESLLTSPDSKSKSRCLSTRSSLSGSQELCPTKIVESVKRRQEVQNAKKAAWKHFADTLKEYGLSEDFIDIKVPTPQKLLSESVNRMYLTNEDQESLKVDPVEQAESTADQEEYQDDYEDVDESESVEKYGREREIEFANAGDQYSEGKESEHEDQESHCDT